MCEGELGNSEAGALVLAALLIWLVVALVGAISEHGLKGAVDLLQRSLKWLWEGSPKGSGT